VTAQRQEIRLIEASAFKAAPALMLAAAVTLLLGCDRAPSSGGSRPADAGRSAPGRASPGALEGASGAAPQAVASPGAAGSESESPVVSVAERDPEHDVPTPSGSAGIPGGGTADLGADHEADQDHDAGGAGTVPKALDHDVDPSRRRDFGEVATGSVLEHTFNLGNSTLEEWRVKRLHAGCRCLLPSIDVDRIVPGGTLRISVRVDTLGFEGARRSHVDVEFVNGTGRTKVERFDATWRTREFIASAPRPLRAMDVGPGETRKIQLSLKSVDATPFRILSAKAVVEGIAVAVAVAPATASAGSEHSLQLSVTGAAPPRRGGGVIEIETDDPRQPKLRLPIEIDLVPGWGMTPSGSLGFGKLLSGDRTEKTVHVSTRLPRDGFKVLDASLVPKRVGESLDFLSVRLDQRSDGSGDVTVSVVAPVPRSHFFCDLVITTNDPETPGRRVPVFGFSADSK
jgi:hypothetical protein